jgi:hypothetical protein
MRKIVGLLLVTIIMGACRSTVIGGPDPSRVNPPGTSPTAGSEAPNLDPPRSAPGEDDAEGGTRRNPRIDDPNIYRYSKLLTDDAIRPVYDPQFIPADEAPLKDDELVIGVAIDGNAKAYPISVLRFREMVNDDLAGMHILVTW